jgi:hypothetical protein
MTKQLSMVGDLSMKLRGVTDALATSLQDLVAKRPDLPMRSSTSRQTPAGSRSCRRR